MTLDLQSSRAIPISVGTTCLLAAHRNSDWTGLNCCIFGNANFLPLVACLPFGLRSSPFLFDTLASALEYILKHYLHNPHIIHYLDDFLIAGPPRPSTCLTTFTAIAELRLPGSSCQGREMHTPCNSHHLPGDRHRSDPNSSP